MAKQATLLFLYKGKNVNSEALPKILSKFSKQYQWEVISISIDGVICSHFPQSIYDPTFAKEMGVKTFPSLFVVDMSTLNATSIDGNIITINEIEENVLSIFSMHGSLRLLLLNHEFSFLFSKV